MVRKEISMHHRTTIAQRIPKKLGQKVSSYIIQIRHLRKTRQYSARNIEAMDETGLWLDMPGRRTLNERGARTVAIKTMGHEKDRFMVVLAARADGSKMHPMVIFRGKRKDKSLQKLTGVVIEMQENAWMTEELTLRWLQMLWRGVAALRERRMLVWDNFRAHKTAQIKACADEVCNTDLVFVPPGCTSLLQAPDLCWNKPFKQRYSELYDEWCISGSETYTTAGNQRPPTKEECISWVKAAWASVSKETVIRSFKCAGLTTAVDGWEDMLISCLADNADLAEDVHQRLYQQEHLQPAVREEPAEREEPEEHLILSEDSEDSDFDGFEPDDLLSY